MQTPVTLLFLILLIPLISGILIGLFCRKQGALAMVLSVGSAGLQMALCLYLLWSEAWDGTTIHLNYEWMRLGLFSFNLGFLFDKNAALMLFVVNFVGFWIHLFSAGYMKDDEARGRFYLGMSIFMFSMTGLVISSNLMMMFIFWELVGFSSYMLIGHYLTKNAANAANKAFIVNRVGDFGFLIGIIWAYWVFGTTDIATLQSLVAQRPDLLITPISLLLIAGVLGKSAQVPLHVWLPDAMEGPTPVSALIHAATMVAAGVYLLGRIYFLYTPTALDAIILIGGITAVFAAICAFGTRDIKKILAYSTLSQLGYLVAAFGLGTEYGHRPEVIAEHGANAAALFGVGAANFHLTTHAFFKALLFLGAGSIIHALHHEQDIFKMGGLWKSMPVTSITFAVAVLAITGVPPLAGFHSKDAILYIAYLDNPITFYLLTGTAMLTALYMGRLWFVAFWGKPRSVNASHAHESSWVMLIPLIVLALYSALGGFMVMYPRALHFLLHDSVLHPEGASYTLMLAISLIAGIGGLVLAAVIYKPGAAEDRVQQKAPALYAFFASKLYFDEIYTFYVKKIQDRVAIILNFLDLFLVGGLLVRGSAGMVGLLGMISKLSLTGNIQTYVYWFLIGIIGFWLYATGVF